MTRSRRSEADTSVRNVAAAGFDAISNVVNIASSQAVTSGNVVAAAFGVQSVAERGGGVDAEIDEAKRHLAKLPEGRQKEVVEGECGRSWLVVVCRTLDCAPGYAPFRT